MDPKGPIAMSKSLIMKKLGFQKRSQVQTQQYASETFVNPFTNEFDLGGANSLLYWVCCCASKEQKCIREGQGKMPFV